MPAPKEEARYQLELYGYPDEQAIPTACRLIYGSADRNLIATLSSLPYQDSRTFEKEEAERVHKEFVRLGIEHRF